MEKYAGVKITSISKQNWRKEAGLTTVEHSIAGVLIGMAAVAFFPGLQTTVIEYKDFFTNTIVNNGTCGTAVDCVVSLVDR